MAHPSDPVAAQHTVLILLGSGRHPSHSSALAEAIGEAFEQIGQWRVTAYGEAQAPVADPRYHADPRRHPDPGVRELVALADAADALVWVSPVYHNSYSSHIKTLLDHLANAQVERKVVGLASHGGHRGSQAVDALRIVARGFNAIASPTNVCTRGDDYADLPGGGYRLTSDEIHGRIRRFAAEIDAMTHALAAFRRRD